MTEITLFHEKPTSIMAIVAELRENGYVQHKDFDFAYNPGVQFGFGDDLIPRHTVFSFYTDSLATWFVLKYVK